jgi:hypothetical protein
MRRFFVLTVALVFALAAGLLAAPDTGAQEQVRARIWTRGAFGSGIAVSQADPMDFELIKVGIAGVKFNLGENESIVKVGILYFGETKYRLRNVVIGNGTASADIYLNETLAGSVSLDSYVKGDREVWAGTLTLDGKGYNAYVIQIPGDLRPVEKAERIHEYCRNNPDRCRAVMRAVGQIVCDPVTDGNCRNRIRDFCEQNPEDSRCKALRWAYCRANTEDADCRAELMGVCRNNATDNACKVLAEVYNRNIEKRPEALENAPQWFLTIRERLRTAIQQQGQPGGA